MGSALRTTWRKSSSVFVETGSTSSCLQNGTSVGGEVCISVVTRFWDGRGTELPRSSCSASSTSDSAETDLTSERGKGSSGRGKPGGLACNLSA